MSVYLNLYIKNDTGEGFTFLADHSGSGLDIIYEAMESIVASYTTIQPITWSDFNSGIHYIEDEINQNNKLIETYKKTVKSLSENYKDLDKLADKIFEFEHSILELESNNNDLVKAIATLETYERITSGILNEVPRIYGGIECYPPKPESSKDEVRDEIKIALYNNEVQKEEEVLE